LLEYLRHLWIDVDDLLRHSQGLSKTVFLQDETLQRAFVRSIEIIGEASKKLPDEFKQKYPQVEWRAMTGMRDRLIHGYFGVDYEIVWDVVTHKIPTLRIEIEKILQQERI
jgi:uncharacterized protein with HEPN domain